jgi:hypothetical protein
MTAAEFRELVLSLPETVEGAHMRHPDFRAHGRIFATLGYPDPNWGMVNLPPSEQQRFVEAHPHVFERAKGAWGLKGSTLVRLAKASPDVLQQALDVSWQANATKVKAPAKAARKSVVRSS